MKNFSKKNFKKYYFNIFLIFYIYISLEAEKFSSKPNRFFKAKMNWNLSRTKYARIRSWESCVHQNHRNTRCLHLWTELTIINLFWSEFFFSLIIPINYHRSTITVIDLSIFLKFKSKNTILARKAIPCGFNCCKTTLLIHCQNWTFEYSFPLPNSIMNRFKYFVFDFSREKINKFD